jgi:hypothetical protein
MWIQGTQVKPEALLALELFQLDPTAKKSRDLLIQHLVEVAMFEHENARSLSEITTAVSEFLNQLIVFSNNECGEALTHSCATGRISQLEDGNYTLTEQTKTKLSEGIERIKKAEREFDQGLVECVEGRIDKVLDPFAEVVLCRTVKEVIQHVFYKNALKLRRMLSGECDFSVLLESDSDAESELEHRLETFTSLQRDAAVKDTLLGIQWFLGNLNEVQKHFIANLHHRVFYFQILNVDPRLQELEEECFKRTRLYLDTNVVISYLCEGAIFHEAVFNILNTTKMLGVKVLISSKTLQETEWLVQEAKNFSAYLNDPHIGARLLSNPVAMSNPIIETFLAKRRENPRLAWAGFISPFSDLETYLITHDIEVSDDNSGDVLTDDFYPRVRATITDVKGELTPPSIIEHDTYNLILVQRLRSIYAGTPLGSSVWLMTIDKKLPKVDRSLHSIYPNPHCQMLEQWGAALLPFQNVGRFMATDEYIAYLASQELGAIFSEEVLDIHFFEELERGELELDYVLESDPEIAFRSLVDLQQDREARTLLAQIQSIPDEEKESVRSELRDRALTIISKRSEEEKEWDRREIDRLRKGVNELSEELRKMQLAKVKNVEKIQLVEQKLETTKMELVRYERMSFWQRVKYVLRGRGK